MVTTLDHHITTQLTGAVFVVDKTEMGAGCSRMDSISDSGGGSAQPRTLLASIAMVTALDSGTGPQRSMESDPLPA
ncbi:MAG: hypothetical protein WB795_02365 [Candidatus Acidiferrales bacterium]